MVDDQFDEGSMCNDGTTINDRLFQTLDTVQHDYQLGTQYASTRAMVEIPLFDDFFFENEDEGIFPGPDNSMKLHLDPTYAAPTWAPNPVGRRAPSVAPEDPTVNSAFSTSIKQIHIAEAQTSQPYDSTNRRIYVQDCQSFPDCYGCTRYSCTDGAPVSAGRFYHQVNGCCMTSVTQVAILK